MEEYIVIAVLVVVIGLAVRYVYKARKSGKKCIGCPNGCSCNFKACSGSCSCSDTTGHEN